ncbi:MAG TPA: type II toxin-antitoxin system HicA family toxin [Candidatus Hydrogenedentes bacterium]|nr:type II toxin-antitoxin system HicA family toxin [Candidatus Hydrogenedentota bacterium]HRZ16588.1 type II toxin-antitoxin system HicA family toxin [Candidatus Hydrogenedentota bacterium]
MRLPRDVSGQELARRLEALGYVVTRTTGSHQRLTTSVGGEHHVTVPLHSPLRLGTLAAVLSDVSAHFSLSREEILERLWGK